MGVYKIPTGSMEPNLKTGDFVIAWKLSYGLTPPWSEKKLWMNPPQRGDVAVFTCPDDLTAKCVKRVIGVAGDSIKMVNGRVLVNGVETLYAEAKSENFKGQEAVLNQKSYKLFVEKPSGSKSYKVILSEAEPKEEAEPEEYVVPEGEAFVLGDYRAKSEDSRIWGNVPYEAFESKVSMIWLSLEWEKPSGGLAERPGVRWRRLFQSVR